jgi:hypothetical protein
MNTSHFALPGIIAHATAIRTAALIASTVALINLTIAQDLLPQFHVPQHEQAMRALNEMHSLHHDAAFTNCTLWDGWLPQATLWASAKKREQFRDSLLSRRIDAEGYVSMQQHRGMAHSAGWPFPAWQQSTGVGFHFSTAGDTWAIQNFALKPLESVEDWELQGAESLGIDHTVGWKLKATGDVVTITTPLFRCGTIVAPFARIEWAARGLSEKSRPKVEWLLEGEGEWAADRSASFPALRGADGMQYTEIPLYKQPGYAGLLTRYRLTIDQARGAEIDLKSLITAIDTRHPITGSLFIRGCVDYFCWSGDIDFLQHNMDRMRAALRYSIDEFSVRQEKHVLVPWVGHDGRSGLAFDANGKKSARPGFGVGNNYWDLLPFGAHDAIATMYLYDAMLAMATVEDEIRSHDEWGIAPPESNLSAGPLRQLAAEVQQEFQQRFWKEDTGRFVGWIDLDGRAYDYGFTFVNLEAIHYGLASKDQARRILGWVRGDRIVAADTSQGADIYHWRFAPRATTLRNVETYVWPWYSPESIPWGYQVQDGGAVLGFSYFDLMARLKVLGPDDAWARLQEILTWFGEVQSEGGYRAYYTKPDRGTLQGGGPPGGLGVDREFMESVLVPQVMLYGFLGAEPTPSGLRITPRLPTDWPSMTITGIHFQDHVFDVEVDHENVRVKFHQRGAKPLRILDGDGRNQRID